MRKNKILLSFLITLLIFNVAFAAEESTEVKKDTKVEKNLALTIEEAVQLGLENSIDLRMVRNEIDLSALKQDRTEYLSKKLKDGDRKLKNASEEISKNQKLLDEEKQKLSYAESLINKANDADKMIVTPDGKAIPLSVYAQSLGVSTAMAEAGYRNKLQEGSETINSNQIKLDSMRDEIPAGKSTLLDSLQEAGTSISDKLKFDSLESLTIDSTSDLMSTMAGISYEVTNASYDIYKNQIAMLIQKNYYDVLKAQKIFAVKEKAMERAKKQYEFAKDSYDVGMKAKDDMLLAEVYYKSTQIECRKAEGDLENALIELKKNLNLSLDTDIVLTDVLVDERETPDLEEGLESGLKNRLEIRKTLGEVAIYDLNFEQTKEKYPDMTFQYKEAKLLKEKARLGYDKAFQGVETSIKQSYETLITVGDMMENAKEMVEKARESVEIAEFKYKEGFGVESSLLKKLDLESAAGTIVEVLAAEENLSNVEEKVVEIIYSYNLIKVKYYNDAGKFIY